MFCDHCGEKIENGSTFCDKCGNHILSKSADVKEKFPALFLSHLKNLYNKIRKSKIDISTHKFGFYALILFLLIGGFFIFKLYSSTQEQLQKTQNELISLKESTNEAISAQKKLIEQQGENLSKQDEALKKSQANETLLRAALNNAEKTRDNVSNVSSNNSLLSEIAPSIVKIFCLSDAYSETIQQGSGILYKAAAGNYYVQTNLHVVDTDDGSTSKCAIAIYPDYSVSYNYLLFNSQSYKFYNKNLDIAFITPQLISDNSHAGTLNDLARYARDENKSPNCESVNIGDHLSILGYPGVGGDTLTITDGIVSGFEFYSGSRYIKTSAKIEHGNSGGIAIKDSGCVAGIPTFVESGSVESIGRILDLHYLFNVTLK
jgi:Trypsin-like peptidase domain/zinc-ribbon domain